MKFRYVFRARKGQKNIRIVEKHTTDRKGYPLTSGEQAYEDAVEIARNRNWELVAVEQIV
ncbi:MAG: hypothetical protein DRP08_05205 [Candidatus Aenigmatarchaeota archaeon]|nr:MAG: hypothetical protein DRP08_05205 [Candidatus Aenigmarchaeota archaeon]